MIDEPRSHRFLTIEQVAEELNVKASLIRGLIKTAELRALQVGSRGMWRVGRQDVEDYIVKCLPADSWTDCRRRPRRLRADLEPLG